MKRYLKILHGFTPLLLVLLIQGIVQLGAMLGYKLLSGGIDPTEEFTYYSSIIAVTASGIIFYMWYQRILPIDDGGKGKFLRWKIISCLVMMGIGMQFLVSGCITILSPLMVRSMNNYSDTLKSIFSGHPVVVFLYVVIIAPVVEELIFRGVVFQRALKILPFLGANLLQAAAFGILHGNIVQGVFTFFIGLILGWVIGKYKTIWSTILVHMALNGASYLIKYVPVDMGFVVIMTVVGGILVGGSLYILLLRLGKEN